MLPTRTVYSGSNCFHGFACSSIRCGLWGVFLCILLDCRCQERPPGAFSRKEVLAAIAECDVPNGQATAAARALEGQTFTQFRNLSMLLRSLAYSDSDVACILRCLLATSRTSAGGAVPAAVVERCDYCLTSTGQLARCAECSFRKYCSVECQRSAWKAHKVWSCAAGTRLTAPGVPPYMTLEDVKAGQRKIQENHSKTLIAALRGEFRLLGSTKPRLATRDARTVPGAVIPLAECLQMEKYEIMFNDPTLSMREFKSYTPNEYHACDLPRELSALLRVDKFYEGGLHYLIGELNIFYSMVVNFLARGTAMPYPGPCGAACRSSAALKGKLRQI